MTLSTSASDTPSIYFSRTYSLTCAPVLKADSVDSNHRDWDGCSYVMLATAKANSVPSSSTLPKVLRVRSAYRQLSQDSHR